MVAVVGGERISDFAMFVKGAFAYFVGGGGGGGRREKIRFCYVRIRIAAFMGLKVNFNLHSQYTSSINYFLLITIIVFS